MKAILLLTSLVLFRFCQQDETVAQKPERVAEADSILADVIKTVRRNGDSIAKWEVLVDSLLKMARSRPIWGNRFEISGDFDGNGTVETLTEKYVDAPTNREINKFWDFGSFDEQRFGVSAYDTEVQWACERNPKSVLVCSDSTVQPFELSRGGQLFGVLSLENEGDLNGDGADEISYVMDWADWSNCNSVRLATFKSGRWEAVDSQQILESDFYYEEGAKPPPRPKYYLKKADGRVFCKGRDFEKRGGDYAWKQLRTDF